MNLATQPAALCAIVIADLVSANHALKSKPIKFQQNLIRSFRASITATSAVMASFWWL